MNLGAHNRRSGGFTLIEILVTLGLILIMFWLIWYPLMAGLTLMEKGVARADALGAARLAMDAMSRELAEAMYVFDPPLDGGFIAFLPATSSASDAAPVAPQATAVRYWRALRQPAATYTPFYGLAITAAWRAGGTATITTNVSHGLAPGDLVKIAGVTPDSFDGEFSVLAVPSATSFTYDQAAQGDELGTGGTVIPDRALNPYFLARTEIPDPAYAGDAWNDSAGALRRATFWYLDDYEYPVGESPAVLWPTSQPGYPWLEAVRLYSGQTDRKRWYRERAVGLTPDHPDYDVPAASFEAERIAEEALVPWTGAFPRDYSRYRGRYPLWVGFAQYDPTQSAGSRLVRAGEIKVYAGSPRTLVYQTAPDATTGDVWVLRAWSIEAAPTGADRAGNLVTITTENDHGFTVGDGVLIAGVTPSSFNGVFTVASVPSPTTLTYAQSGPDESGGGGTAGTPRYNTAVYPSRNVADPYQAEFAFGIDYDRGEVLFDFPATDQIAASASMYIYDLPSVSGTLDLDPEPARDSRQVVRGSTTVWVHNPATGGLTYYTQVSPAPSNRSTIGQSRYVVEGLKLIFDPDSGEHPVDGEEIYVRYRYRNNRDDQLVVATYATKAIINVALTVSKRDIAARNPAASRQDANLTTKVKLKNVPR